MRALSQIDLLSGMKQVHAGQQQTWYCRAESHTAKEVPSGEKASPAASDVGSAMCESGFQSRAENRLT